MKEIRASSVLLKRQNQVGLTLIELLISIVIVSVVLTLCTNGFTFGSKVWAKVDQRQASLDEISTAQRLIRKVLSEAVFYPIDEGQTGSKYFSGDQERMLFLAPSPQYGLDDYLYIYEIFKQKENGAYNLSIRYLPANTYFAGNANFASRDVKLIKNVKNIRFEYFGLSQSTGSLNWYDAWRNQSALPSRVSIAIENFPDTADWPPLIVETKFGGYILP